MSVLNDCLNVTKLPKRDFLPSFAWSHKHTDFDFKNMLALLDWDLVTEMWSFYAYHVTGCGLSYSMFTVVYKKGKSCLDFIVPVWWSLTLGNMLTVAMVAAQDRPKQLAKEVNTLCM